MAERYERVDADNLRVIVESEHIIPKETLLSMIINLEKEKQRIQTNIDKIQTRLVVLDKEI